MKGSRSGRGTADSNLTPTTEELLATRPPDPDTILARHEHRPWPVPGTPWIMRQSWYDVLFAHWPVAPETLRPVVPPTLPLDLFDGRAWVGIVPFLVGDARPRALPGVPGASEFLELNMRTYVTLEGKPGVYFFSLDAASALAVLGARTLYRLNYFEAVMSSTDEAGWIRYRSQRKGSGAAFDARYHGTGDVVTADPGTLDYFLTERYCLYSTGREDRVWRVDIQHAPWPLQRAECELAHESVSAAAGIVLPAVPPLLHYAAAQHVLVWPPEPLF